MSRAAPISQLVTTTALRVSSLSAVIQERVASWNGRWVTDAGIAVAVTAVQLALLAVSWRHQQAGGSPGWAAYLLLGIGGMSLLARRRFPEAVLAVALGTALLAGAISNAGMIWIVPIAAFVNAVLARKRLAAILSLVIGYIVSFLPVGRTGTGGPSVTLAIGVAAWLLVLLAAAELVRIRRQRAAAVARSSQEQLLRQASEERVRMARDIHDVLAHNISVINVQANTALHLMDRQPERAREALTSIHDVSRQALAELRSVLGMLRSPGDGAPTAPSPGMSRVPDLIAAVQRAGLEVRLTVEGDVWPLPADADVAAYRIIQEALTNTSRHSASRTAGVLVRYQAASPSDEARDDGGVSIQVDDDGPARRARDHAAAPVRPAGGNGITGMIERAEALGGTLSAGTRPGGGFRVAAWLPARSPRPASAGMDSIAAAPAGPGSANGSRR
jgi:signal transduction histidine kinase